MCIRDRSSPGWYPDSTTNLVNSYVGLSYNESIQINVPITTQLNIFGQPVTVDIDSMVVDNILGFPSGFTYSCDLVNCQVLGGTSLCITIYSITDPTSIDVGIYPLDIQYTDYANNVPFIGTFSQNIINSDYVIEIVNNNSGCTDSTATNYDPSANNDDGSCFYCDISVSYTHLTLPTKRIV